MDVLDQILAIVQADPGGRGLRSDPNDNLITATAGDFAAACHQLADRHNPHVAIVTGFTIPSAQPPCSETDGPLGALYLARALVMMGIGVSLASDGTAVAALRAGIASVNLADAVPVIELPEDPVDYWWQFRTSVGNIDVMIACERVGPSHTIESVPMEHRDEFVNAVPANAMGRCYTMRGCDVTDLTRPAHLLFDQSCHAIGIGDGGNEIGMGKVPWATIRNNITNGGLVACRVATDQLIVAGISNWGAYALAAGVRYLRHAPFDEALYNLDEEERLLKLMVEVGPLVDGVTAQQTATVDGLSFADYATALKAIGDVVRPIGR